MAPCSRAPARSASGDLSNGCTSAGPHFNPFERTHGAPSDQNRHVGDLGNIQSDSRGVASVSIEDSLVTLNGIFSVVGCVAAFPAFCCARRGAKLTDRGCVQARARRARGACVRPSRAAVADAPLGLQGEDDLGRGGDDESLKTGNAGARLACGVIARDPVGVGEASDNDELCHCSRCCRSGAPLVVMGTVYASPNNPTAMGHDPAVPSRQLSHSPFT